MSHMTMKQERTYLGDGVYAWFDGFQIWLETNRFVNMEERTERIALDPDVFQALYIYGKGRVYDVPRI